MKIRVYNLLVLISIFFSSNQHLDAITLVYNMKIRRQFNVAASASFGKQKKSLYIVTAVPIIYKRDRHIIDEDLAIDIYEKRLSTGCVVNFRYVAPKAWWAEVTTGIENESVKSRGSSNFKDSRFGLDDIVLSGGYNMFPTDKSQFVLYGLGGIPTRTKVTTLEAQDTLIGTRFYSLGIGAEFSYSFINTLPKSLITIFQVRFLHLFNRRWDPILPVDAKIQPGNVTDVLFSAQYRKKKNIFEVGYNPTIFTNQAVILKTGKVESPNFVRQSMYFSFSHIIENFPVINVPGVVGAGVNIGGSKRFDTEILAFWVDASLVF